jgi:hypothetical protein
VAVAPGKMRPGQLLGRFFTTTRPPLGDVAEHLSLKHVPNPGRGPPTCQRANAASPGAPGVRLRREDCGVNVPHGKVDRIDERPVTDPYVGRHSTIW